MIFQSVVCAGGSFCSIMTVIRMKTDLAEIFKGIGGTAISLGEFNTSHH